MTQRIFWFVSLACYGSAAIYGMAVGSWLILLDYRFWLLLVVGTVAATVADVLRSGAAIGMPCRCGEDGEGQGHHAAR